MKRTKHEGVLATLTTHRRHLVGAITLAMVAAAFTLGSGPAGADTIPAITFEASQNYVIGDINGQPVPPGPLPNGVWSKTGAYDAAAASVATFPDASGYGSDPGPCGSLTRSQAAVSAIRRSRQVSRMKPARPVGRRPPVALRCELPDRHDTGHPAVGGLHDDRGYPPAESAAHDGEP